MKNSQITNKTQADKLAEKRRYEYKKVIDRLNMASIGLLLTSIDDYKRWFSYQKSHLTAFEREVNQILNEEIKTLNKQLLEAKDSIKLASKQLKEIRTESNKLLVSAGQQVIANHKATINEMKLKKSLSFDMDTFQRELAETVSAIGKNDENGKRVVEYANKKCYPLESYIEMKERTAMHKYVSENMLEEGHESGVIFYICSYYGDCAEDHIPMQEQGIFYDKDWKSMVPEKYREVVENWMSEHKNYLSIQDAMGDKGKKFTTRPNCRHYFQAVSIETVLTNDIVEWQKEHNMRLKGKYDDDKAKALNMQRYNERQIRKWKFELAKKQEVMHSISKDNKIAYAYAQKNYRQAKQKVHDWQQVQVDLLNKYNNLQRKTMRERI